MDIEKNFKYYPPKNEQQIGKYECIREAGKSFSYLIDRACPESREKSLAFTKIEEAVMWANAAIARNE